LFYLNDAKLKIFITLLFIYIVDYWELKSKVQFIRYKMHHQTTTEIIQKAVTTPRRKRIWGLYSRMLYIGTLPMSVLAGASLEPSGLRCSRTRYCTSHP
jgi:hypothetical protein